MSSTDALSFDNHFLQIPGEPKTIEYHVLEAALPAEGVRFSLAENSELVNNSGISPKRVGENVGKATAMLSDKTTQITSFLSTIVIAYI